MEITSVKVRLFDAHPLLGFAEIVFDDSFAVHGIRIIEGAQDLFCAMPTRRKKDGVHVDVAHPIRQECREMIEDAVLDEFHRMKAEGEAQPAIANTTAWIRGPYRGPYG